MRITVGCAVLIVLALAGCSTGSTSGGSSSAPSSSRPASLVATTSSATAASSPTPSPSDTAWTQAVAQQQYLALAGPSNAALDAIDVADKTGSLSSLTAACSTEVDTLDAFQRGLATGSWPRAAQDPVTGLIGALSTVRVAYQMCASASTEENADAALDSVGNSASAAAQTLRIALGLPGTS